MMNGVLPSLTATPVFYKPNQDQLDLQLLRVALFFGTLSALQMFL